MEANHTNTIITPRRIFLQGASQSLAARKRETHPPCVAVEKKFPGDRDRLARMSLIEEGYPQQVRMANLACIGGNVSFSAPRLSIDPAM